MPPQDTHEEDKLTPEQRETRERERAGRTATLAAGEAREDEALAILREAHEGAELENREKIAEKERQQELREWKLSREAEKLARKKVRSLDAGYRGDWADVAFEAPELPTDLQGDDREIALKAYQKQMIRIIIDAEKKRPAVYGQELEAKHIQEQEQQRVFWASQAQKAAEEKFNESDDSWEQVMDETDGYIKDCLLFSEGRTHEPTSEEFVYSMQDRYLDATAADFGYMAEVYRKEIQRMKDAANGMTPEEYRNELFNEAEGVVINSLKKVLKEIEGIEWRCIVFLAKDGGALTNAYLYNSQRDSQYISDELLRIRTQLDGKQAYKAFEMVENLIVRQRRQMGNQYSNEQITRKAILRMAKEGYPQMRMS